MSGHSKWANIRVKKTAEDARRGKIFTRHARLIEMAARSGSPDPVTNNALRTAIESARAENVPNTNIERAIKKGSGQLQGEQMSEILYAAYGPGGVACLIECLTDNRNRTLANVKMIMHKHGGTWAELGSVQWMFERRGVVVAKLPMTEQLELELIDAGAEDIDATGETIDVTTNPADWPRVRDFLKGKGFEIVKAGLEYVPTQSVAITDPEVAKKTFAFIEAVEADDDVDAVHTNADISPEIAAQL